MFTGYNIHLSSLIQHCLLVNKIYPRKTRVCVRLYLGGVGVGMRARSARGLGGHRLLSSVRPGVTRLFLHRRLRVLLQRLQTKWQNDKITTVNSWLPTESRGQGLWVTYSADNPCKTKIEETYHVNSSKKIYLH